MKYNLYCYYDRVSGVYSAPIPAVNRASAIRQFLAQVKDSLGANDMELYEVGTFETFSGDICSQKPVFVCRYEEYNTPAEV